MKFVVVALVALTLMTACAVSTRERDIQELSGMELYEGLCSSCHGLKGRGDGPVAPLLNIGLPDLTRVASRNGGKFPTEDVRRAIDGRWDRRAHGARDMPVWGWRLYASPAANDPEERARVDSMLSRLVEYLHSIQVE